MMCLSLVDGFCRLGEGLGKWTKSIPKREGMSRRLLSKLTDLLYRDSPMSEPKSGAEWNNHTAPTQHRPIRHISPLSLAKANSLPWRKAKEHIALEHILRWPKMNLQLSSIARGLRSRPRFDAGPVDPEKCPVPTL